MGLIVCSFVIVALLFSLSQQSTLGPSTPASWKLSNLFQSKLVFYLATHTLMLSENVK